MKPILISGAGLGGLLLARSLRSHTIPFEIFERDSSMHARGQGYRIRISTDGVNALKAVLTASEFEVFKKGTAETGGGGMHFLDGVTGEPVEKALDAPKANANADVKKSQLGGDVLGCCERVLEARID